MPSRSPSRPKSAVDQAQVIQSSETSASSPDVVLLPHNIRNKVGTILAHCALISVKSPGDSKNLQHLHAIRNAAQLIVDMVSGVQSKCGLSRSKPPFSNESS